MIISDLNHLETISEESSTIVRGGFLFSSLMSFEVIERKTFEFSDGTQGVAGRAIGTTSSGQEVEFNFSYLQSEVVHSGM